MQHVTMADKSFLIGDETARLLLEWAALVAKMSSGDAVHIHSISDDGDEVMANLLLNSGTALMTESSHSPLPEPENAKVDAYLRERIGAYEINTEDFIGFPQESAEQSSD